VGLLNMKTTSIFRLLGLGFAMAVGAGACTSDFEKVNLDPTRPTLTDPAVAPVAANGLFSAAISNGLMRAGEFQRVQALYADLYAGYYATSATYFASDRYQVNQGWLDFGWNLFIPRDINNLVGIIDSKFSSNNQKQIARIWKVFLFHRMVDFYGDIPYFNAAKPDVAEKWDSQQDIYKDMFKELDEAAKGLDNGASYDAKDVIYAGNVANWKAFANTLRLRLALRVSKADRTLAETNAKAAIAGGIFTSNAQNALARVNADQPNALNQITGWNEFRMGASAESILDGYQDPRGVEFYGAVGGKLKGIRNGAGSGSLGAAINAATSNVSARFSVAQQATNPRIVLTYAEACLLMAEAAVNGWATEGDAKTWYERGITASMNQFGISNNTAIAAYLSSTKVPVAPEGADRPVSTLPVRFSTTQAEQREQIAIQKWLAVYPDGFEGWSEFRRTGFPKLYAPVQIDASSDVKAGDFIQRIPYTDNMKALNKEGVATAEARMGVAGGSAGQSTKLWFAGGK
jgi:hypothetical protein